MKICIDDLAWRWRLSGDLDDSGLWNWLPLRWLSLQLLINWNMVCRRQTAKGKNYGSNVVSWNTNGKSRRTFSTSLKASIKRQIIVLFDWTNTGGCSMRIIWMTNGRNYWPMNVCYNHYGIVDNTGLICRAVKVKKATIAFLLILWNWCSWSCSSLFQNDDIRYIYSKIESCPEMLVPSIPISTCRPRRLWARFHSIYKNVLKVAIKTPKIELSMVEKSCCVPKMRRSSFYQVG